MTSNPPPGERVTLITGAASGTGRALSERLAARGERVVAADIRGDELAWTGEHPNVVAAVADVSTPEGNRGMVEVALTRFGRLDALALNAAVMSLGGTIEEMPLEYLDRILAVNFTGAVLGIRAATPVMRAQGGGAIVVTSALAGQRGIPKLWAYSASKAAVINLVLSAALELGPQNIRVNTVSPGPIAGTAATAALPDTAPQYYAELARAVPLHRWGDPGEIAAAIDFLLSPAASYINGAILPVDGGALVPLPWYSPDHSRFDRDAAGDTAPVSHR